MEEKVKIIGIIRSFILPAKVDFTTLSKIREFIRTKDIKILNALKREGLVLNYTCQHNLIATVGRSVLAGLLSGDTTYTGEVNYGALGTQVSPVPANGDTQLGTEVYRKVPSSQSFDDNITYIDFFYAAADCNGTYTEFGNFIDGSAGANTGQLFSHIATGGWTKSSSQSLFVSCQYTIL